MGIEALYRKPNLSRKHLAHKIWPYLLRDRKIERSNQVFALDTTYVPMAQGFVYLTAVIDWASRRVLAHRVAITMEAEHAVAALEEAFTKYGLPEIVNTDQGSQFTSTVFTDAVLSRGIALSMDGKGSWRDKACASHYTSLRRSDTTSGTRHRQDSLMPCAFRGGSLPGGSYKHSFLSLYA
jgi:putative transposase